MAEDNIQQIMSYLRDFKKDITKRVDGLDAKVDKNHEEIKNGFVTKDAFEPVRTIAYGLVGAVGTTVILAILGLVIIGGN